MTKQQGKKVSVVHTPHGDVEIRLDSSTMTYFFEIANTYFSHTDGVKIVAMAKEEMEKLNASVQWIPIIEAQHRIHFGNHELQISRSRCAKFEDGWRDASSENWNQKPDVWVKHSRPMGDVGDNPTRPRRTTKFGETTYILSYSDELWEALSGYKDALLRPQRAVKSVFEKMIETDNFDPAPINKINAHLRELAPDPKENEEDE